MAIGDSAQIRIDIQAQVNLGATGVYGAAAAYGGAAVGAAQFAAPMGLSPAAFVQLTASASLGMGWGAFSGGLYGQAMQAQGAWGAMGAYGLATPGSFGLQMAGAAGAGGIAGMENAIEVAGTGMGADKKYKMLPGELLAVYSLMKEKEHIKPEELQKQLKERYGIEAEIKDIDGRKALVNTATGNVMIRDGNGNNQMDKNDMKFEEAVKGLEDRFGINVDQFQQRYDRGKQGSLDLGIGFGGYAGAAQGANGGLWADPNWLNYVYNLFALALQYARTYQGRIL